MHDHAIDDDLSIERDHTPGEEGIADYDEDTAEERPNSYDWLDRLIDWCTADSSRSARLTAGAWLAAIFLLCSGYYLWDSISQGVATSHEKSRAWLDQFLTGRQQTLALTTLGLFIVYHIWRAFQIRRGIKPVPWMLIALTACVALGFTLISTWLMFREASKASAEAAPQLRFDAIKTGITLFAGTAGVGALLLSFRSHFNSETDRLNAQFDSAADKMSNSSAVIQTAGILAIERIALKHRAYRRSATALLRAYTTSGEAQNEWQAVRVIRRLGGYH